MCILSNCWRAVWQAAFGTRPRRIAQPGSRRPLSSTRSTSRKFSLPSLAQIGIYRICPRRRPIRLPATTSQTLERILARHDQQCNRKRNMRFELEPNLKQKNKKAALRLNEHENETAIERGYDQSLERTLRETEFVLNSRSEAERLVKKGRDQINENKRRQLRDEHLYNEDVNDYIKAGGERNDPQNPLPTVVATQGLKQACEDDEALRNEIEDAATLRSRLLEVRALARQKLQEAGLTKYEKSVRKLKLDIEATENRISKLQDSRHAGLNAFYTARGENLGATKFSEPQQQPKTRLSADQEKKLKDRCSSRLKLVQDKYEELQSHRICHEIPLTQYLQEQTNGLVVSDKIKRQHERDFTNIYVDRWRDLLYQLHGLEGLYVDAVKKAQAQGVAVAIDNARFGDDLPAISDSGPNDGRTASFDTETVEAHKQRAIRHEPEIDEWNNRTRQNAPSFARAAIAQIEQERFNDKTMTPDRRARDAAAAKANELPDAAVIAALNEEPDDDSINPWESASSADRGPRRKALLDRYRQHCEDLNFD